jgi:hypothetical protein
MNPKIIIFIILLLVMVSISSFIIYRIYSENGDKDEDTDVGSGDEDKDVEIVDSIGIAPASTMNGVYNPYDYQSTIPPPEPPKLVLTFNTSDFAAPDDATVAEFRGITIEELEAEREENDNVPINYAMTSPLSGTNTATNPLFM